MLLQIEYFVFQRECIFFFDYVSLVSELFGFESGSVYSIFPLLAYKKWKTMEKQMSVLAWILMKMKDLHSMCVRTMFTEIDCNRQFGVNESFRYKLRTKAIYKSRQIKKKLKKEEWKNNVTIEFEDKHQKGLLFAGVQSREREGGEGFFIYIL